MRHMKRIYGLIAILVIAYAGIVTIRIHRLQGELLDLKAGNDEFKRFRQQLVTVLIQNLPSFAHGDTKGPTDSSSREMKAITAYMSLMPVSIMNLRPGLMEVNALPANPRP